MRFGATKLNLLLNTVSIACAGLIIWQFASRSREQATRSLNTLKVGSVIETAQGNWDKNKKKVLLAISPTCGFCRSSSTFYRTLIQNSPTDQVQTIALIPSDVKDSLKPAELGIEQINLIDSRDLATIGVMATPTVIVLDGPGKVLASWTGKLSPEQEKEVYRHALGLFPQDSSLPPPITRATSEVKSVTSDELLKYLRDKNALIVDVRLRHDFNRAHLAQSINIPLDEIEARIGHEVPKDRPVHIYCHHSATCKVNKESDTAKPNLNLCQVAGVTLGWSAFHQVRYISDGLAKLARDGLSVIGAPCD